MASLCSIYINLPQAGLLQYRLIVRGLLREAESHSNLKINLSSFFFFLLEDMQAGIDQGRVGILTEGGFPNGPPGLLGKVPMVAVRQPLDTGRLPRVLIDPGSVAETAFAHFSQQGVTHFGVFHNLDPREPEGLIRSEAFTERVRKEKLHVHAFPNGPRCAETWGFRKQIDDLADWLRELPAPCGILAGDDEHGQRLLMAAAEAGVTVPGDMSVISYGNDELF
ncbi:MAG: substrate-binding domain-containing protein [Verrucomicrobia bacterium]|nr:substrate-binding domain-containing protein [Verrucomicrobiota bacterium]MCH8513117.1 substrate-binding domain-containing protein [Kiritimatiellia bacterium]